MKYSELVATGIENPEDYGEAFRLLSDEFTEHEHTDLKFYDYVVLVKYKKRGVGLITGMRYLPSKVIISDIVVDPQYRGHGVGLKLLKGLNQKVKADGFTYIMGITDTDNRQSVELYRRFGAVWSEQSVMIAEVAHGLSLMEQKEMLLKHREKRREKE